MNSSAISLANMPLDAQAGSSNETAGPSPTSNVLKYSDSIRGYTSLNLSNSLFPGDAMSNFEAHFLRQNRSETPPNSTSDTFATLYQFSLLTQKHSKTLNTVSELHKAFAEVAAAHSNSQAEQQCVMLFLRGFPAPEWLDAIGTLFEVDPVFFQNHMELPTSFERNPTFSHPPLPSATRNILQLRYISIGQRAEGVEYQKDIDVHRKDVEGQLKRYHSDLCIPKHRKAGDSIVRAYYIHNKRYFSVEQNISMCRLTAPWGWVNLVWHDSGNDLSEGPVGPWKESKRTYNNRNTFLPTIQWLPGIALYHRWRQMLLPRELSGQLKQSACLLQENYGKSLQIELAAANAFYAFHELYSFSAHSICQFLNLIESIVMDETGYKTAENQQFSQLNLLYHQDILNRLARALSNSVQGIKSEGSDSADGPGLSRVLTEEQRAFLEHKRNLLLNDFIELQSRTERLILRCANGMDAITNRAMIAESKRALSQTQKIEQLTYIATFYIPLSFMTSFFGMNLERFGQGNIPLWWWFAIAIPVTMASLLAVRLLNYIPGWIKL